MVYTQKEKERMDRLLEIYRRFLAQSEDVDVVYSEKVGYVRLIVDECADPFFFRIEDFEHMLSDFVMDVVYEEVKKAYEQDDDLTNQTMNYELPRKRMQDYVKDLDGDRECALSLIEKYIAYYRDSEYLP